MNMDLIHEEWEAWQLVVKEFNASVGDINAYDPLVKAIQLWGEKLVKLRVSQSPEEREKALSDNQQRYDMVVPEFSDLDLYDDKDKS